VKGGEAGWTDVAQPLGSAATKQPERLGLVASQQRVEHSMRASACQGARGRHGAGPWKVVAAIQIAAKTSLLPTRAMQMEKPGVPRILYHSRRTFELVLPFSLIILLKIGKADSDILQSSNATHNFTARQTWG
jgi:hypothetical protein